LSPPKDSGGSGSNFNPQNTQYIPACPVECEAYSSGVVIPPKYGGGSPFPPAWKPYGLEAGPEA